MVKAENSQLSKQHSAWHPPYLNDMSTLIHPGQQNSLPAYMDTGTNSANVAFPGCSAFGLGFSKAGQSNGAHGLVQHLPRLESPLVTPNPYLKESQCAFNYGLDVKATPNAVDGSNHRKFLIFDRSGNQTRFFFSPFCSPSHNPIIVPKMSVPSCDLNEGNLAAIVEQKSPTKPFIQGKLGENDIIGEVSEMHEDTEEINALLYSDDYYEDDDDCDSEDDEVASTGHSPNAIARSYEKHEQIEEITEEVASSDGSNKRQKFLGGGYKVSSLMNTSSSVKVGRHCECDNDEKSSCAQSRIEGKHISSSLGNKRSTKNNIRMTLSILQSILPGIKSNDPLLIIDEAINYLNALKHEAKDLGVNYP